MKVNIRDSQIDLWQELAELIGAKHPADAVSFVGARYLPALISKLRSESEMLPNKPEVVQAVPKRSGSEQLGIGRTGTEFDDLFNSIAH